MHERDMTETQNSVSVEEEDLPIYIRVYRSLNETFRGSTRFILLHVVDGTWEVRVIGLTSREWLEFCANVFAELPSETANLVDEPYTENHVSNFPSEVPSDESTEEGELEDAAAEEEDDDTEEEESNDDSVNSDGENPSEEIQRKLRKAKIVRKTGNSAVTVEAD